VHPDEDVPNNRESEVLVQKHVSLETCEKNQKKMRERHKNCSFESRILIKHLTPDSECVFFFHFTMGWVFEVSDALSYRLKPLLELLFTSLDGENYSKDSYGSTELFARSSGNGRYRVTKASL
jgi:hypothetical protein